MNGFSIPRSKTLPHRLKSGGSKNEGYESDHTIGGKGYQVSLSDFLERPIAYHRCFVRLGIGISGAVMLSQSIYWSERTSDPDGGFTKQ